MRDKPDYYDIEELRLFLVEPHMEVRTTGKELSPSRIHRSFLLALAGKSPAVITYKELWRNVWRSRYDMDADDRAKIQTTKGQLTAWLKGNGIISLLIESQMGEGYRLNNEVIPGWFDDDQRGEVDKIGSRRELVFSNALYIIAAAICYGVLFQITALMEIAYEFDAFGNQAILGGFVLMLVNTAAVLTASGLIGYRLYYDKAGLLLAIGIMLAAILFSIIIAGQFLPVHSVTKAAFQTQPALIAFWKNALLYFFPLVVIFILLPLYTVSVNRRIELQIIKEPPFDFIFIQPKWLLVICLCLMLFSFAATNYLLDYLNPNNRYYPLFVGLIFLRMFIYFGLALSSLAWYYGKIVKQK